MLVIVMAAAAGSVVMLVFVVVVTAAATALAMIVRFRGMGVLVVMVVVMPAAAPFAVPMTVPMTVPMAVLMPMVMIVAVIMTMMMIVVIVMVVLCLEVGAALGVEGCLDRADLAAEARYHLLDHVVAADAQARTHDLHRQVAVAEVPGELKQVIRTLGADLAERFGRADHLDEAPIFQLHRVAGAQGHGLLEVEQEFKATHCVKRDPPPVTIVEFQHDAVRRLALPVALRDHFIGPDHLGSFNSIASRGARPHCGSSRRKRGREPAGS